MHICIISPDYPTSKTIDFVFVEQLCRALTSNGQRVTVIAPQSITKCVIRRVPIVKVKSIVPISKDKAYTLIRPKYVSVGNLKCLKKHNGNAFKRAVKRGLDIIDGEIDAIYGHFWQSVSAAKSISKYNMIPLFASSGEETVSQRRLGLTSESISEIQQHIRGSIHVSTNNKIECIATGLILEEKSIVIPNAINPDLFYPRDKQKVREELGIPNDVFVVAFVGQFTERKGTLRLDDALKRLNNRNVKAIFIGKGSEVPTYDGIIIKKSISHDELPKYLSASDIFVLPTRQEGCCNAIIEAMACGLPIISSNLPFNYDVLNNKNSIMVNPDDVDAISVSIEKLYKNTALREYLSNNALHTASKLNLDERARRIISFISKSINEETLL